MQVELGNAAPKSGGQLADLGGAPAVTYVNIPDEYTFDENVDTLELQRHLYRTIATGVTQRPDDEAMLAVIHPSAFWNAHSASEGPTWVHCTDNPAFAKALAAFYDCPAVRPADVEETHVTKFGPPGVSLPIDPIAGSTMLLTNNGRDILSAAFLGGTVGEANTFTATSATTGTRSGATWTTNQWAKQIVVSAGVYAVVLSNSATVLTLDQWYNLATPGGAAGATPGATSTYVIMTGAAFAIFMGLSNTNITPVVSDTTMTGEIVTAGGGLIRKQATWAHTAGTTTTTLTSVYTVNGSDTIPVTVYAMNISTSIKTGSAVTMTYETSLSSSATLSAVSDQLTVTSTVTSI